MGLCVQPGDLVRLLVGAVIHRNGGREVYVLHDRKYSTVEKVSWTGGIARVEWGDEAGRVWCLLSNIAELTPLEQLASVGWVL